MSRGARGVDEPLAVGREGKVLDSLEPLEAGKLLGSGLGVLALVAGFTISAGFAPFTSPSSLALDTFVSVVLFVASSAVFFSFPAAASSGGGACLNACGASHDFSLRCSAPSNA
jgi:hypothetical protein